MTSKTDDVREAVARVEALRLELEAEAVRFGALLSYAHFGRKGCEQLASGLRRILALISPAPAGVAGEAVDEPLRWFLRMVEAAGGTVNSNDSPHNPINVFCDDRGEQTDTFNLSEERGYTHTTHDSDFDTSTTVLTEKGRSILAALSAAEPAPVALDEGAAGEPVRWHRLGDVIPERHWGLLLAKKNDGEDFWRVRDANLYLRHEGAFASVHHLKDGAIPRDWWFDSIYPGKGDLRLAREDLLWAYMPTPDAHPSPPPAAQDDRLRKAVEALREISELCPATTEMTTAHDMAQIATETLAALNPEAAK